LDQLLPYNATEAEVRAALDLTHRWELRSLEQHLLDPRGQAMYSVIHGGTDQDMRRESVELLTSKPFDGHAIGGSLGKSKADLIALLDFVLPLLPQEKPNHILGIGDMRNIMDAVPLGADTFDSSYPTRLARHGGALQGIDEKVVRVTKGMYKEDSRPLMPGCECYTCKNYSRAYINHLFRANEPTAFTLMTTHNIYRMTDNMKVVRQRILDGTM